MKLFNREDYSYDLLGSYSEASEILRKRIDRNFIKRFNQNEQFKETQELKGKIGREKMSLYLRTKHKVDDLIHVRLRDIARKIRFFKRLD